MKAVQTMIRDHLFYISLFVFSLVTCCEHLFLGQSNAACFLKGMACSLGAVGIVLLFVRKKRQ